GIEGMAEAGKGLAAASALLDERRRALGSRRVGDEGFHPIASGAVERARERGEPGADASVQIGADRCCDPRGERGRVQLVIGAQDERRVDGALGPGSTLRAKREREGPCDASRMYGSERVLGPTRSSD